MRMCDGSLIDLILRILSGSQGYHGTMLKETLEKINFAKFGN